LVCICPDAQGIPGWQRDFGLARYLDEVSAAADLAGKAACAKALQAVEDAKNKLNAAKIAKHWAVLAHARAAESLRRSDTVSAADWLD
jgi:hypothetical protein